MKNRFLRFVVVLLALTAMLALYGCGGKSAAMNDDTVYAAFERNGSYNLALNGKNYSWVARASDVTVYEAENHAFAFLHDTLEKRVFLLGEKRNEEILSDVDAVLAVAACAPSMVYRTADGVYFYRKGDSIKLTTDASADHFVISGDGETVLYNVTDKDTCYMRMCVSERDVLLGSHRNIVPITLSEDGKVFYGVSAGGSDLYRFEYKDDVLKAENTVSSLPARGRFGRVVSMTQDTETIVFTLYVDNAPMTYLYNCDKEEYRVLGNGVLEPDRRTWDSVYPKSYENCLFVSMTDTETTTYILKKDTTEMITHTVGQISSDGKYFYYINRSRQLVKLTIGSYKKMYEEEVVTDEVTQFALTSSNDLYYTRQEDQFAALYYYDVGSDESKILSYEALSGSLAVLGNTAYYCVVSGDTSYLYFSQKGGKSTKADDLFEDHEVSSPMTILRENGKMALVYFEDEGLLFYTKNGKKFALLQDHVTDVYPLK